MSHSTQLKYNRGVSLLEVLFAIIILSVALLATARLHAMVTQDGSYAKARGIAANLAQEKLDDLKSFSVLYDNPDTTLVNECAAPTYCYSEIGTNAGGKEKTDGTLELISGDITVGNTGYNRTWTVTDYYNCTPAGAASTSNCASPNAKPYPDFKAVTLTVKWSDEKGTEQLVTMQTVVYSSDPSSQVRMAASSSGGGPKVSYTPIGVPDAVPVPINTGGTNFKESSKPVPDVNTSGNNIEVSFDAVSYVNNGSGGYDTTEREEFTTVTCECSFNGTGSANTPSRMVWNGTSLEAKVGDKVSKPIGTPESGQSDFCTACCKDHHDVGGFSGTDYPKYDPDRPSSEYAADGDHKHYWYSNCVAGTLGKTSGCNAADKNPANGYGVVDSGAYLDSCRFKRVDGLWRIWQDWRQVKMTVLPYDFLPVTTNLEAYVDVVEAVVENTVRTDSGNGSKTIPALSGRDFTLTPSNVTPLVSPQLLGRALYVDRVYKEDAPTTLDSDYYDELIAKIVANDDWLKVVPFYEANLTLLIDWSSASTNIATVSSETIKDITDVSAGYYASYSRGYITGVSGGDAVISATSRVHNSGVTGGVNSASPSYGVSTYDNSSTLTDSITVTIPGTPSTVKGYFQQSNDDSDLSKISLTSTGATCTLGAISITGNTREYTCPGVMNNTVITLSYSSTATGAAFSPAGSTTFTSSGPTGPNVQVYGQTLTISGTIAKTGGGKLTSVSGTNGLVCDPVAAKDTKYKCTVSRGTGYTGTLTFVGDNPSPATYSYTGQNEDTGVTVNVSK